MPIHVKTPDGIAEFPDGMSDAAITSVLQKEYPQPSTMDRIAGSPIGRAVQANVVSPVLNAATNMVSPLQSLGSVGNAIIHSSPTLSAFLTGGPVADKAFAQSVAHNQNTPGYAAARAQADKVTDTRGGSGFSDQMTSTVNPALAGTVGLTGDFSGGWRDWLDRSNAAADSQQAAQSAYQKQHPVASVGAGVLGSLLLAPTKSAAASIPTYQGDNGIITRMAHGPDAPITPRATPPTIEELGAAKDAAYKAADQSGVVIKPEAWNNFAKELGQKITKDGVVHPNIHANALDALGVIQDETAGGNPVSLSRADLVRQAVNGAIEKAAGPAGNSKDLAKAMEVKTSLDSFLDDLTPQDTLAGDPSVAVPILKQARDLASREFKAKQIQQMIDQAANQASTNYGQAGFEQALRVQFKNLRAKFIADPTYAKTFTDAERAAIGAVADGGPVSNALRALGKYAPHGPMSTAIGAGLGGSAGAAFGGLMGGAVGANAGAIALPALGEAARSGATSMTRAAAQRALDIAAMGKNAPALNMPPALQMPALTPQSRLPIGLLPLLLQKQAREAQPQPN